MYTHTRACTLSLSLPLFLSLSLSHQLINVIKVCKKPVSIDEDKEGLKTELVSDNIILEMELLWPSHHFA